MPKKSNRDPARPKRYQSSFMLFLGEFRKRNSNRGYSNSEMSSKGAAVWRQLPALEKLPYEDRAAELKQKYAKEMAKYKQRQRNKPIAQSEQSTSRGKKATRDPDKPKKAMTSYMYWMKDFREANSHRGWDVTDMMSRGARVWRSMNSEERSVYEDMATKDSNRYHRQMTQYTRKLERKTPRKTRDKTQIKKYQTAKTSSKSRKQDSTRRAQVKKSSTRRSNKRSASSRR